MISRRFCAWNLQAYSYRYLTAIALVGDADWGVQIGVCPLPTRVGSVRADVLYLGTVHSMSIIDSVPTVLEIMLMLR
jgi:hypothetical protein